MGVAGMIITSDYGSFHHSLRLAPVSGEEHMTTTRPYDSNRLRAERTRAVDHETSGISHKQMYITFI